MNSQNSVDPVYSFEFFPAKTQAGEEKLKNTWHTLAELKPKYFSVTFGAGGSTQDRTYETVKKIQQQSGIDAAPHISCIGSTKQSIQQMLQDYQALGIKRLVALRGDMPSGMRDPGDFRYANELVAFIREETGDHFHIEVAAYPEFHPQASNKENDLNNFKNKVEAGANSALTQYFYNPDAYFYFVDDCIKLNINIPIIPGLMPITNYHQLARFSDICGSEIPRWIRKRLEYYADDLDALKELGLDILTDLAQTLLDAGAPGLHIYTMNRADTSVELWQRLGLSDQSP